MTHNSVSTSSQTQGTVSNPVQLPLLKKGAIDPYVSLLQRFLVVYGHLKSTAGSNPVDGNFSTKTANAVVEFQQFHNIKPADGEVGAQTWYAIAYPSAKTPKSLTPIANVRAVLPTLQVGNSGPLVNILQRLLVIYSQPAHAIFPVQPLPESFVDGEFGGLTEDVVQRFKIALKSVYPDMSVTSAVDALTWEALLFPKGK